MNQSKLISIKQEEASSGEEIFDAGRRIQDAVTPELVIVLCGPLGTPLHDVAVKIQLLMKRIHDYDDVNIIRLSEYIREMGAPISDKISDMIDAGNNMRSIYGASVLAQLAIKEIMLSRGEQVKEDVAEVIGDKIKPAPIIKRCHIIDSIKNKEELNLLRSVYGEILHVISVYAPLPIRVKRLERKLRDPQQLHSLINRDSGEEQKEGQSVRDIFPLADFFLRVNENTDDQITKPIERYLDLLLRKTVVTPTANERAMYAAHAAASNSACLSRQVGAAITDGGGDILAVGWNDVPKPFGGLYQALDFSSALVDHRCWNKSGGYCSNDEEKMRISEELADALVNAGIVESTKKNEVANKLRSSSELKGLIEFSRAVHAEMHALLNAGQVAGMKIKGGKIFVTTYPCHSCARHIIASGINEVHFIEPYRKSLATKLHEDAITESESEKDKVRIIPFSGVAPARYLKLFGDARLGRKNATVNIDGAYHCGHS